MSGESGKLLQLDQVRRKPHKIKVLYHEKNRWEKVGQRENGGGANDPADAKKSK